MTFNFDNFFSFYDIDLHNSQIEVPKMVQKIFQLAKQTSYCEGFKNFILYCEFSYFLGT